MMIDYTYLPDIILILISGSACLYCGALNRRLRKLQNLKTGVGASIVSLTDAITQTNKAAKEAQSSTLQTVETLRHLLAKAESAAPKIDALTEEMIRSSNAAQKQKQLIDSHIENILAPTIEKDHATAADLLQAVTDIDQYVDRVKTNSGVIANPADHSHSPVQPSGLKKFKIVSV